MTLPVLPIAHASRAVHDALLAELARQERKYRRRRMVRRIDRALGECELAALNGASGEAPPARAAALVEKLQELAEEPVTRPRTAEEAHEELLRLQESWLLTHRFVDNDGDLAAAVVDKDAVR